MTVLRLALITVVLAVIGTDSHAQSSQEDLQTLEQAMKAANERQKTLESEAKKVGSEIDALTSKMIALAKEIQDQETSLTRVEIELEALEEDLDEQREALAAKRGDLSSTLAAMQKLSRQPTSLLFLRPVSAKETSQSAALLSGVVPVLNEQAAVIRSDLITMQNLKTRLETTQATYEVQLAALDDSRIELEDARGERQARRRTLSAEAKAEAKRVAQLAGKAKTLEGLLARLRKERTRINAVARPIPRPTAPPAYAVKQPAPLFTDARGQMPLPVRGQVLASYGKRYDGQKSAGLWIAARPNAQVIAPYDGQVVFADRFRSYGRLLIIEHSEGYHSVIAGLERADVDVGQYIVSGEPIGIMGDSKRQFSVPNNPLGLPVLYLELQRNGKPEDPSPWLTAKLESTSR